MQVHGLPPNSEEKFYFLCHWFLPGDPKTNKNKNVFVLASLLSISIDISLQFFLRGHFQAPPHGVAHLTKYRISLLSQILSHSNWHTCSTLWKGPTRASPDMHPKHINRTGKNCTVIPRSVTIFIWMGILFWKYP